MISINGSSGGGQMLRTALSLSAVLGKEFEFTDIRGAREKAGLARQHLTCVRAVAELCNAEVEGAVLGSTDLVFKPREVVSKNRFVYDVGSAGSVSLVFQTIFPVLCFARHEASVELIGGTNVAWSPSADYIQNVFLPLAEKFGARASFEITRRGWFPKGGGRLKASVLPVKSLHSADFQQKGLLKEVRASVVSSNLPSSVNVKEESFLKKTLPQNVVVESLDAPADSPGNCVFVKAVYENSVVAGFSSLGERGKPSEVVVAEAVNAFNSFNSSALAVDEHAGDQLLLLSALAKGKTVIALAETKHVSTNLSVLKAFLGERVVESRAVVGGVVLAIDGVGLENKLL